MKFWPHLLATALISALLPSVVQGQTIRKEIDIGYLGIDLVRPVIEQAKTHEGKFVILPHKGSILLIDTAEGVQAVESALASADLPTANVALDFQFVSGLPVRRHSSFIGHEVPLPTSYVAPTVIVQPGRYTVIPATPTKFSTRRIGARSETVSQVNADGSITMDINSEVSRLDGFINYGSAILPAGSVGVVPVSGGVSDPTYFVPLIDPGAIRMPIISTTRISTSIVIRPRLSLGQISLDVLPRLTIKSGENADDEESLTDEIDLKQFQTLVELPANGSTRFDGFAGASGEFNRHFLSDIDRLEEGATSIVVKSKVTAPTAGKAGAE